MWILLGYNTVKCDCELYSRSVNLFPLAKLPSHLKVFQLADEEAETPRGTVLMYMYTYIQARVPKDFQICCSNDRIFYKWFVTQLFWLANIIARILKSHSFLICLFVFNGLCMKHFGKGTLQESVHALDLEKGNNSNACNSILSGSVWGQIYWADLVFQYFVAVGYRSSTPDFFQNQSLLTFVKLIKNFHMLKCWFFQQHLTS